MTARYEVDGCELQPEVRSPPYPVPGEWVVLVPEREWLPALLLHVAFVRHFSGELEARS